MSQGNDFANYASSDEDRSSASEDVWFVAVASDDIKQMSVDQLDEAFRLGVITAQTAVWTEGMEAWAPLGEVADLDADDASGEHETAPAGFADPAPTLRGVSDSHVQASHGHLDLEPASFPASSFPGGSYASGGHTSGGHASGGDTLPSQRRTSPGWHNPFEGPADHGQADRGQADRGHGSLPPAGRSSMGPSSFAPVTASYAPPAGSYSGSALGQSTGPVALNVDEDMPPVSRGRRFRPERWLLAAAGIVAVGVVAFNNKDVFSSSSVASAEKQASAAALVMHPYEAGADKSAAAKSAAAMSAAAKSAAAEPGTQHAAPSADDGKDAPIGSLKGEHAEEEAEAPAAAEPLAKLSKDSLGSAGKDADSDSASKEALRGGFAKAFSKPVPSAKPVKAAKAAKAAKPVKAAKLARKAPSRAAGKGKKPGVARAESAFDPLNPSLP